jgi:hypothetical protein
LLIGRVYLAQVLGTLADDVYGPAGHRLAPCRSINITYVKSALRRGRYVGF